MATLRKGKSYRSLTRAYTRKSKFKKKGFIKAIPTSKIVRFQMGTPKKYAFKVSLISLDNTHIRHNAIESSRLIINKFLTDKIGLNNYYFQINIFPHHILRENKMLTGAGADRLSSGMSQSFGKAAGLAARVRKGKTIFTTYVNKEHLNIARESLKKATPRLPGKCFIEVKEAE